MKSIYVCVLIVVFVALLGFATCEDAPIAGNNPCSWGPSYWCKNAATAKECDITAEHCAERYGGFSEQ
ncbi:Prosaposin [Pseudolycoriella hygida]|uniref:Prosaposin n=1 Tax=Pseudolycoriella hygida TaxID=35572 RepID=A0A9Q0RSM8_9DIPT|nr:Prosaposin [Pseudolycoriella hygida]